MSVRQARTQFNDEAMLMTLLLIPTRFEANRLLDEAIFEEAGPACLSGRLGGRAVTAAICGFGLAEAGAGAAWWLAMAGETEGPVVLAGLAGTYDASLAPLGSAVVGSAAWCEGIGVGEGAGHRSAHRLGWGLTPEQALEALAVPESMPAGVLRGGILSVAAASADEAEAGRRRDLNGGALLEEMETWSVLAAARLAGRRVLVVRGVSNRAGDREHAGWEIGAAMKAVGQAIDALTANK